MISRTKQILCIAVGNFLVAVAVVFLILPNNILSGGVASLAMALSPFVPVSRVFLINALTIVLFLIGAFVLGRKFAFKSLLSSILYPLMVSALSTLDTKPLETVDPILAALFAGLLTGVGLGLVFKVNASTGGMDIPALIMHKYMNIPLGSCVMIVDSLTILLGLCTYGINSILTGLVAVFASNYAINWTQTIGASAAKNVMIVSEKWEEIRDYMLYQVGRGVTILEGRGAWTNQNRPVLLCVIANRQFAKLEQDVAKIDPKAFMVITDVHEVRGSGFTFKDESFDE